MKNRSICLILALFALITGSSQAQVIYEPYNFSTLAGLPLTTGTTDNTGNLARFNQPWGLAVDAAKNVYVADTLNQTIRKVTPGGVVTTLAGVPGSAGFNNGAAGTALFSRPTGIAVDSSGTTLYVADYNNQVIRKISGGIVTTVAGSVGVGGSTDATGTQALFRNPFGLALNTNGTLLYVSDQNNSTIRVITLPGGVVTTLAGAALANGSTDSAINLNARFNTPRGIAVDTAGNVYVADAGNFTIRKILAGGGVTTLVGVAFSSGPVDGPGSSARFSALSGMSPFGGPCGLAVDTFGNIFVTDQGNRTIRKVSPWGNVTTLGGLALNTGSADGVANIARFNFPAGVAVDGSGNLYIADTSNHTIRSATNAVPTFGGFDHYAVGNATLVISATDLMVTNIGTGGTDGVHVDLGGPNRFKLNTYYEAPQGTGSVTFTSIGFVNAKAKTIGIATVNLDGTNGTYSYDFSSIGAATYTMQIFNGSKLVFESEGNSGVGFLKTETFKFTPLPHDDMHMGYFYGPELEFYCPSYITSTAASVVAHKVPAGAAGFQTIMGDAVVIIPENPTSTVEGISGMRIQASGIPQIKIVNETLTRSKSTYSAAGNAKLKPMGDRLMMANLNTPGLVPPSVSYFPNPQQDPPKLALDWCGEPGCGVYPCMCITSTDVSALLELFGTVNATPGSKLSSVRVANGDVNGDGIADSVALSSDYPTLGSITLGYKFYLAENLVFSISGQPSTMPLYFSWAPGKIQFNGITHEDTWDAPVTYDNWGSRITFDSLQVTPDNANPMAFGGPYNIKFSTTKIPALAVLNYNPPKPCVAVPAGLALWLPFDETSGLTSTNLFTGGNVGTRVNGPTNGIGFVANSLAFDGTNQYVEVQSYSAINPGIGDFSVDAWVKRDSRSGNNVRIILDKRDSSNIGYSLSVSFGNLLFQLCDAPFAYTNYRDTGIVPADNQWHFVAVTISRGATGGGKFYIDGVPTGTFDPTNHPGSLSNTHSFLVGHTLFGGAFPWMGGIDEVEMFNRVLTPTEIAALWGAGASGKCKNSCATPLVIIPSKDKSVECGSAWKFDLPTVTTCCASTNITFNIFSTVTNGICPQTVTRIWTVSNSCGDTATTSQKVTLVDTTPPVIICPTNRIIVPLNAKCEFEIPDLRPMATDKCTPRDLLVYTQNPTPGTIITTALCQTVTFTVRDACDNLSRCEVLVCGQDKTPPVLICPARPVEVVDCLVPNVLGLVSATDGCTAANKLIFTQSPAAGSPLAAGVNSVTVTVTDAAGNSAVCSMSLITASGTSFLTNLFNTGVDATKVLVAGGTIDSHYKLGPVPVGTSTGPGFYTAPNAITLSSGAFWPLPPLTSSLWIAPGVNIGSYPIGNYVYTNEFVLPAGGNPLTASISGRWAADNGGKMYLNGLAPANLVSVMPDTLPTSFSQWTPFVVNGGFLAAPAVNRFYFVVTNTETTFGFVGLRVEFTDAAINCGACAPPIVLQQMPSQTRSYGGTAVFSLNLAGTPPYTIQWYRNNVAITNGTPHFSGLNTPTLTISPLTLGDAGSYYAEISNACGKTRSIPARLAVTLVWNGGGSKWAAWNFSRRSSPLAATYGPDLTMDGMNYTAVSAGTSREFLLPDLGGKPANVLHVPPFPQGSFIRMPFISPQGMDSITQFTVFMDVFAPMSPMGPVTYMTIFDRWGNLKLESIPGAGGQMLRASTYSGTTTINAGTLSLAPGKWNRIALVVDSGMADTMNIAPYFALYLNGKPAGMASLTKNGQGTLTLSSGNTISVFSSPEGTSSENYAAELLFHSGVAFTPEMIAGMGSPDHGPMPSDDTTSVPSPMLGSKRMIDIITLSWKGSAFVLQEKSNLTSDAWMDSGLPFDEMSDVTGQIMITAPVDPTKEGQTKFYRLIHP